MVMKTMILHDYLNPARIVPLDSEEFALASPYLSSSSLYLKSNEMPVFVHETPEEIANLLEKDESS